MSRRAILAGIALSYALLILAPLVVPYPRIGRAELAAYVLLAVFAGGVVLHVVAVVSFRAWPAALCAAGSVVMLFAVLIWALTVVTGDSL